MNIEMGNIPVEHHATSRGTCEAASNSSADDAVCTSSPHVPSSGGSPATSDTEVALSRNNHAVPVVGARSDGTGLLHYVPNTGMASDEAFVERCINIFGIGRVRAFLNALILMREQAFFTADVNLVSWSPPHNFPVTDGI